MQLRLTFANSKFVVGGLIRRYVPGAGLDDYAAYTTGTGGGITRDWPVTDPLGSVVGVTNSSATATQINTYDEYGVPGASFSGRFGYAGSMYLNRAMAAPWNMRNRQYNPTLGRFMQTDPIGIAGGVNLYGYVGNDPVNLIDPWGLQPAELPDTYSLCSQSTACRCIMLARRGEGFCTNSYSMEEVGGWFWDEFQPVLSGLGGGMIAEGRCDLRQAADSFRIGAAVLDTGGWLAVGGATLSAAGGEADGIGAWGSVAGVLFTTATLVDLTASGLDALTGDYAPLVISTAGALTPAPIAIDDAVLRAMVRQSSGSLVSRAASSARGNSGAC